MTRVLTASILVLALTGCGEVVVFGHVVRENPAKTEAAASKPATEPAAPTPAAEVAAPTSVAASPKPATEAAPPKAATETALPPATETALPPANDVALPAATEAALTPATEVAAPPAAAAAAPSVAAASSTQAAQQSSTAAARDLSTPHLLHAVNVTLSPASQASTASIDAAALLDAIRAELRSRALLDEQNPSADRTAEILVEGATTRRTVNAVVFGRQPMAGTLTGELHVSSASGDSRTSRIVAESRYSVTDDGQDKNALGPLYRRFAVLTADELTGIAPN